MAWPAGVDRPVLGFDTSGPHILAGLSHSLPIIEDSFEEMERGQAERLIPLLEEHLARAGLGWRDLGAIGVGIGPGNFTGVRIAVSAARGLALGLGIPAVGVSGFEQLLQGYGFSSRVMVSLPAQRGQAYVQTFLHKTPLEPPAMLTPGEEAPQLQQPGLVVIGYEAQAVARGLGASFYDDPWLNWAETKRGATLALIAENKLRYGCAGGRPAPLYVRGPDAALPADPPPIILPG